MRARVNQPITEQRPAAEEPARGDDVARHVNQFRHHMDPLLQQIPPRMRYRSTSSDAAVVQGRP
ncbi:hypothetical protein GCM10018962_43440 [Dactylosporangium matsuzakiense]|uniref:Uncharacterized protein n=1 Tax=Dactylosporangium matsuzakiense TaxID=53360 RepID=A0A9W6KEJ3_9ACTN|nr:hypothetical protein GCM10017581_015780 [Dactylosporangium matsuzakiense]